MTVSELITKLQAMPPELPVRIFEGEYGGWEDIISVENLTSNDGTPIVGVSYV